MEASGVQRAIQKAGGQEPLGEACGVSQQAVSLWLQQGYVPWERVRKVSEMTGIPRRELCDPRLVDLLQG